MAFRKGEGLSFEWTKEGSMMILRYVMNIKGAHARAPLGHGCLKVQFRFILTLNKLSRFFCNEKKVWSQNKYLFIFFPHQIN